MRSAITPDKVVSSSSRRSRHLSTAAPTAMASISRSSVTRYLHSVFHVDCLDLSASRTRLANGINRSTSGHRRYSGRGAYGVQKCMRLQAYFREFILRVAERDDCAAGTDRDLVTTDNHRSDDNVQGTGAREREIPDSP